MWVDMAALDGRIGAEKPLKSWKEIASFFGRDERTVKRWEAGRGLPVHRVPGRTRASVYAYPSELEARPEPCRGTCGARLHDLLLGP
jgi:hypothetical protein